MCLNIVLKLKQAFHHNQEITGNINTIYISVYV